MLPDEVVDDLGLAGALHGRGLRRELEASVGVLVAALRVEVVGDHEHLAPAELELARQWLAARGPHRVGRVDPPRRQRERRVAVALDHRRARGRAVDRRRAAIDERDARRVEQEDDADVAAGLAAVLVVDRVDLAPAVARAARGHDRVGQLGQRLVGRDRAVVGRAGVVLHLLDRHDVGLGEVGDHALGQALVLGGGVAGRQVLDVVGRHRQLLRGLRGGRDGRQVVVLGGAQRRGGDQVAAELRVVDRAHRGAGEDVAHVDAGVGAVGRHDLDAARGDGVLGQDLGARRGRSSPASAWW